VTRSRAVSKSGRRPDIYFQETFWAQDRGRSFGSGSGSLRAYLGEFTGVAVLLMACAGAAAAEERLSMRFDCQVDGGRVKLAPAAAKSYPIVGAHERRDFTSCAPARSRNCRSFELHRFEIDCGGAKADWLSVAAALGHSTESRNRVRNGRMQIDAGPRYYGPPVPCRVRMPYGPPGFYGPRGRYGPPGFYGPGFIVVPCPGQPASSRQYISLPAGFAPVPNKLVRFISAPDPIAQAKPAPDPGAAPSAVPPQAAKPKPGAKPANIASSAKQSKPEPSSAAKRAAAETEITGAIQAPGQEASASRHLNLIGAVGLGFAALLLFSTAFLLSRRRSREVQLVVPPSHAPIEARPAQDDWLPATLGEALAVLVASPETDSELLKELVKTLRRRWHPDHAQSEDDRRARERKLKQINVAWDIVCGKRRAPRPSFSSQQA
jgi:hypothetical protein